MSSHSGAVPPSFSRLALPVDSEDYALEFLLRRNSDDMPVIGIRTHAQAYARILVSLGYGSLLYLPSPWMVSTQRKFCSSIALGLYYTHYHVCLSHEVAFQID